MYINIQFKHKHVTMIAVMHCAYYLYSIVSLIVYVLAIITLKAPIIVDNC